MENVDESELLALWKKAKALCDKTDSEELTAYDFNHQEDNQAFVYAFVEQLAPLFAKPKREKEAYICRDCGSTNVGVEVCAYIADDGEIDIGDVCEKGHYCDDCKGAVRLERVPFEARHHRNMGWRYASMIEATYDDVAALQFGLATACRSQDQRDEFEAGFDSICCDNSY